jgi:hypothetical protein
MPVSTATAPNGLDHANGKASVSELKKGLNGSSEPEGARYWGKRYIPNQGETFEVGHQPGARSTSADTWTGSQITIRRTYPR